MIGAYFSKPDWHCEYYWWQRYATPNRNNNYNIHQHPWRWQQYINYTHAQINELMSEYGPIDILWLDGGWVRPRETVNQEVLSWGAPIPEWSQDIQMDKIASNSREKQPGLLIVDRTVHGPYENYQTPEQQIPDAVLDNPWESCITLGNNWGYVPGDQFKKPSLIVHKLIEVVAKGGNLLLGMGPDSKGEFSQEQINKLDSIGDWLEKNSEAIYSTRTLPDYQYENIFFTRSKDNQKHYALVCIPVDGSVPEKVIWKGNLPKSGSTMILLATGETVKWRRTGYSIEVSIPAQYRKKNTHTPALTFSFTPEYEL
jgi:alpha-L-fucosidase